MGKNKKGLKYRRKMKKGGKQSAAAPATAPAAAPATAPAAATTGQGSEPVKLNQIEGLQDVIDETNGIKKGKQDYIQKKHATESAKKFREKVSNFIGNRWKDLKGTVDSTLTHVPIMKHLSKWIAFLLILAFVFGLFKFSYNLNRRNAAYNSPDSDKSNPFSKLFNLMSFFTKSISNFLISLRSVLSPLGRKTNNGIPRDIQSSGRCDNVNWISVGGQLDDNNLAFCVNSDIKRPRSVTWVIDPTRLYEYDTLPRKLKDKIAHYKNRVTITIPYRANETGTSYTLRCRDATFNDGTSAGDLFSEETDEYCTLNTKTFDTNSTYTPKIRPLPIGNNPKVLDQYATV